LIGVALAAPALAETRRFALKDGPVSLDVPAGWQALPDYLGVPLMLMGPPVGNGRPVISLTPTGKSYATLKPDELDRNQRDYRTGREAWLARKGGRSLAYAPFRSEKVGSTEFNSIGYRYRLAGGEEYVESSLYVVCKGKLFHLSTLVRGSHESHYSDPVERVIRSFGCE
jgi:hypothetical protein